MHGLADTLPEQVRIRAISEVKYLRDRLKFTPWQIWKVTGYQRYFIDVVYTGKKYADVQIPEQYRLAFNQRYGKA